MNWVPRLASDHDRPALAALIPLSVRALQAPFYSAAQREAALGPVFSVDPQLISDRTYYIVEDEGEIAGAGGWSKRPSLFGAGHGQAQQDIELDPGRDPARIRAFFVHPRWARRGVGRSLLAVSEAAAVAAGFRTAELVATLAGEPLYAAFGYEVKERYEVPLSGSLNLPVVRMTRRLV